MHIFFEVVINSSNGVSFSKFPNSNCNWAFCHIIFHLGNWIWNYLFVRSLFSTNAWSLQSQNSTLKMHIWLRAARLRFFNIFVDVLSCSFLWSGKTAQIGWILKDFSINNMFSRRFSKMEQSCSLPASRAVVQTLRPPVDEGAVAKTHYAYA